MATRNANPVNPTPVVEEEVVVETPVVETPEVETPEVEAENNDYKSIIKRLISQGCKKITNVKIKNVNVSDKDTYTMVSFTINKGIRGYVSNDNGITYEEGVTNIIFTSMYAICGAFKEDENLSWMANSLLTNPQALNLILNGAEVTILQQEISAGEEFINPFSTSSSPEPQVYDHDLIINHVISFKLGKIGERMADKLADKLLGF